MIISHIVAEVLVRGNVLELQDRFRNSDVLQDRDVFIGRHVHNLSGVRRLVAGLFVAWDLCANQPVSRIRYRAGVASMA